jgi:hypothetical protein
VGPLSALREKDGAAVDGECREPELPGVVAEHTVERADSFWLEPELLIVVTL